MSELTPLSEGTVLGGKYRLERLLGKGGMGAVYLAENVDIGRKVAVKVLLPEIAADTEALARFRKEARAAAAIRHPGIAEVIDFGSTPEGGAWLVMEYLEGETVGARLRRAGPIDLQTVGWIGDALLSAVAGAHADGVIHRDLKPDNVFLVEQPVRAVKVLDFGVSKFRRPGEVALTRTGAVMGTPAYMSPEQARGAKDVGPGADLYAVGAILYEALTGAPAFCGDSYNEILAKVLTEPHRPLRELRPDVPAAVAAVVERLLAKPVDQRPADANEARALLAQAFKDEPGGSDISAPTLRPGMASTPPMAPTAAPTPPPAATLPAATPLPQVAAAVPVAPAPPASLAANPRNWPIGRIVFGIAFLFFFWRCGNCLCGRLGRDETRHAERFEQVVYTTDAVLDGGAPEATGDAGVAEGSSILPITPDDVRTMGHEAAEVLKTLEEERRKIVKELPEGRPPEKTRSDRKDKKR